MTPFLVRVRIIELGSSRQGAITVFAAALPTEREALEAARAKMPPKLMLQDVIGHATENLADLLQLKPGEVRQL